MPYDQAQSPRLGQRTPVETTTVRMFSGSQVPEASWPGQIIYIIENQKLQIYNGIAWIDVTSGVLGLLTFVGSVVPVSQHVGDIWFNTADSNRMYVAHMAGADQIIAGEWEVVSSAPPPITPTTHIYQQSTPPGALDTPVPKDYDYWYEIPGNHQYYYLSTAPGTHWVSVIDGGIAVAQAAATAAQNTANVKSAVTYSANSPGTAANRAGDIWFRFAGSEVIEQWKGLGGTSWAQVTIQGTVLSNLDAGRITAGILEGITIRTGPPGDARMELSDSAIGAFLNFWSAGGVNSATITGNSSFLEMESPPLTTGATASIWAQGETAPGHGDSNVTLTGQHIFLAGSVTFGNLFSTVAQVNSMDHGVSTQNTEDGNGSITIPHAMGTTPNNVQITPRDGNRTYQIFSVTPSNFVVRFKKADDNTNLASGTSVSFYWLAIA